MFNNVNNTSGLGRSGRNSSGVNDFLQLDLFFESSLLKADYAFVAEGNWMPHFHKEDYDGNWDALALYSDNGNQDAVFTEQTHPIPTLILERCNYFNSVCRTFQAPILGARILKLRSGSTIKEHTDYKASYSDGIMRIHVPVITDPEVCFLINGKRVEMKSGECWYGDFSLPHSVEHRGVTDRVHIVIDLERNEWTDELMKRSGYDFSAEIKTLPTEVVKRMIKELELSDTPAAAEVIKQLKETYGV